MTTNRKCNTCKYRCYLINAWYCQYILVTGHCRGCSPVKCKRYKRGNPAETIDDTTKIISKRSEQSQRQKQYKSVRRHQEILELYNNGKNDHEIAHELNLAVGTIYNWRQQNNLPPNGHRGFQSTLDKDEATKLYKEGLNDRQISERIGCTRNAIYMWRRKNGLKANAKRGGG